MRRSSSASGFRDSTEHLHSYLDALYFVVVTFATVGYGDINLLEAPAEVKVYGIVAIMLGGLTLALAFGVFY